MILFVFKLLIPDLILVNGPFHSVFEAVGLFAGIFLALLLMLQIDEKKKNSHYFWIASALIGMGIMDGFHAGVNPGNSFVWLHTLGVLFGGFLFNFVWFPAGFSKSKFSRLFLVLVAVASIATGIMVLVFPDAQSVMIVEGNFTFTASALNMLGGILFIVSAIFFLVRYWSNKEVEAIFFSFFCLLNGSSALLFPFGPAWSIEWWLWHILRLIAYFSVLGYIFSVFRNLNEQQRLAELLEKRTAELTHTAQRVKEAVNVLASSSSEILSATTQVAAGTAETATAISETSTTVEEVRQAAQLSSEKARNVSEKAQHVAQVSQNGRKAVEDTANIVMRQIRKQMESIAQTIVRLSDQTQSIGGIIASVTDIADQSNLLAVNAAIEAAKAGEQGKGFAVVAQEIRILAEQSKQATAQVRNILSDIQKATGAAVMATEQGSRVVEDGVKQTAMADEAIRVLAETSDEAAQSAMQIVASSQQQVVGMEQIGIAMKNINQAGSETAASMKQAETAAQNLHDLGQKLREIVEQFKE